MSNNNNYKRLIFFKITTYINEYLNGTTNIKLNEFIESLTEFGKSKANTLQEKEFHSTFVELISQYCEGILDISVLNFYLENQIKLNDNEIERFFNSLTFLISSLNNNNLVKNLEDKELLYFPKVSVIITTYNRKNFLIQAINSILSQDYSNIEIIVIDDCSTDGTDKVMKNQFIDKNKIYYIQNKTNRGPGNNRREAFRLYGDGEYILFLDDDDFLVDKSYIRKAVNFHYYNPEISFVAANVFFYYSLKDDLKISSLGLSSIIDKKEYLLNFEKSGFPKPISTLTTLFKRKSLIDMNILEMNMVNDSSIYLRSLLVGNAGFINSIAGVYRVHDNNITFNLSKEFLVDNLNEKMIIKEMAVEKYGFNKELLDEWFKYNVYNTVSYYFYNSANRFNDFKYLLNWIENNCPTIYRNIRRLSQVVYIKNRLKKIKVLRKFKKIIRGNSKY